MNATMCPIALVERPYRSIQQIEEFVSMIFEILAEQEDIILQMTAELMEWLCHEQPYNDGTGAYYHEIIRLMHHVDIVEKNDNVNVFRQYDCQIRNETCFNEWCEWNEVASGEGLYRGVTKYILLHGELCQIDMDLIGGSNHPCTRKIHVIGGRSIVRITNPYYVVYDMDLPSEGEVVFEPPRNWSSRMSPRDNSNGYHARDGSSWIWHQEERHWDVQLPRGGYRRITNTGHDLG